jgi:hypothetical protein
MEVVRGVHTALEENPEVERVRAEQSKSAGGDTDVFTAYLKNSVTRFVEPLRVIAWRVGACFVPAMGEPVCT